MEEYSNDGRGSPRIVAIVFFASFAIGGVFWYFVGRALIGAMS